MPFFSADLVFPILSAPIPNGVIHTDAQGKIIAIGTAADFPGAEIQLHEGALVPGFVNAHCHLELSHLKGKIPKGSGLVDFILAVQQFRNTDPEEIQEAMKHADKQLHREGIVAIGDISNGSSSFDIKRQSKLYYHTFIELLGFTPERAPGILEQGEKLLNQLGDLPGSLTAHAPYSVSSALFKGIAKRSERLSVHNQECLAEATFFERAAGDFTRLYSTFGIDISFFKAPGTNSIQHYLPLLKDTPKLQLVHNTFSSAGDLAFASKIHPHLFWCLCLNANLYIEKRVPNLPLFDALDKQMTIGTDSLAANHSLSMLDELKTIQQHFPEAGLEKSLRWATYNGAVFLGIENRFGTLAPGKQPGIVHISHLNKGQLTDQSSSRRLL